MLGLHPHKHYAQTLAVVMVHALRIQRIRANATHVWKPPMNTAKQKLYLLGLELTAHCALAHLDMPGQLPHKTTRTISKSSNAPVKVNVIANQANVSTPVKPPSLYISLSNNV